MRKQGRRFCADCTGTREHSAKATLAGAEAIARSAERGVPMTDDEIALALGITRQRVNMIVQSALAKLRAAMTDREAWL